MKKYVIMHYGTEYNDETYSVGGDDGYVSDRGYDSLDAARDAAWEQTKAMLSRAFSLYDFESSDAAFKAAELMGLEVEVRSYGAGKMRREYKEAPWEAHEVEWAKFITMCENAGVDWRPYAPQLFQVCEVEFDG